MEQKETIQVIKEVLNARSVAVVGASANPEKWGYRVLRCIIDGGYQGKIYAVNPNINEILGVGSYPSVKDIPDEVDLLIILVPAEMVANVLRQGSEKGVKGAAIISSGFREAGRKDLEDGLLDSLHNNGMRIIGPNIQGINYVPNKLCAVILPLITKRGAISIIAQSGSVSASLSEWAERDGIGINGMVNLGNQVDLCESDFLEFFAEDENTKVIMLYLEGPKDGKRFKETLKKVAAKKPVVILKTGRTQAGKKAAVTHTASIAGNDTVFTNACKQYGAKRAFAMEEFYDAGKIFAMQRLPAGKNVLIVTTSGGAGALTMDVVDEYGLNPVCLSTGLIAHLKESVTGHGANYANPIDLPFIDSVYWQEAVNVLAKYDIADSVIFSIADAVPGIENVIKDYAAKVKTSLVVAYMGGGQSEITGTAILQESGIPVYPTPERAVKALADLTWYAEYRRNL